MLAVSCSVSGRFAPDGYTDLVGRRDELTRLAVVLAGSRLVTIVGPGGVGKTRVALAAAAQAATSYRDGPWIVELSGLRDPALLPNTVASVLGLPEQDARSALDALIEYLRDRRLLLILDTCEHLLDACAALAQGVMRDAPGVTVLATSRQPLDMPGEHTFPIGPLPVPESDCLPLAGASLADGGDAVELFALRAAAAAPGFAVTTENVADVIRLCRRLDGIPLAIELAAARTAALGLEELAARLDDRFRLLTGGHRTALPRHQTLRATLDWSNELLPAIERTVLRRLAILVGGFTLEAASAVATAADLGAPEVVDSVTNLAAKSLVVVEVVGAVTRYRLLETTRAYALEKLMQSGEFEQVARRHAEYCLDLFERAEAELQTRPAAEWLAAYGRRIDNLRAALDWAFSPTGDVAVGVALTIAAVPLWAQLSLVQECRARVERALASLVPEAGRSAPQEMKLYAALAASLLFSKGPTPETEAVGAKALDIAESLGDTEYQLRALLGLWACRLYRGEYRVALTLAQRFYRLAQDRGDPADLPIGDRLIGVSLHYWGDQTNARRHIERMLSSYVPPVQRSPVIRFIFDQRVMAHVVLARILWLQGFPDQAGCAAQRTLDDARALNHAASLCLALHEAACPVALFTGDLAAAENYVAMLLDCSAAHALPIWRSWGHRVQGTLLIRNGDFDSGLQLLRTALEQSPEADFQPRFTWFLGQLAEGLGRAGQIAQGLDAIDEALARSDRNEERWCVAELLRIRGELLLLQEGSGAAAAAEDHYQQALGWARRQGALSWELRAATSLARLLRDQNRSTEAIALLAPIYNRFTEGFETADLKTAKALIDGFYITEETSQSPLMDAPPKTAAIVELSSGTARRRLA